eukprot:TRINITY_DN14409_c0_g1_i1.p1 TRINITY_DN14409_c0_g1~~TRINITY_DN14409_c0_g1_i1.p1  ORF type:complete len:184 (+),score=51.28 TRINITY_DN14409_c0_g1_i1:89-640(+)
MESNVRSPVSVGQLDVPPVPPSNTAAADSLPTNNGGGPEKWQMTRVNLKEIGVLVDSMQRLFDKAVYLDEEPFAVASTHAHQLRTIKSQERRIRALERELDAAVAAAAHSRASKQQAEVAQKSAEARTLAAVEELNNTSEVFRLHMEELRAKQQELDRKTNEIKVLQAIIQTVSGSSNSKASQ